MLCSPTGNMQNCPRQLAMQSCALCSYVRCGTSNQKINKINLKKSKISKYKKGLFNMFVKCFFSKTILIVLNNQLISFLLEFG